MTPEINLSTAIIVDNLVLDITVEMVLRGQGAEPNQIIKRKPFLQEIARSAIREGISLIRPRIIYKILDVSRVNHNAIICGKYTLKNQMLSGALAPARQVAVVICTIGQEIDHRINEIFPIDPTAGLALDGFGIAAIDALVVEACKMINDQASGRGKWVTSLPYSPGMIGWPVEEGQRVIFDILQPDPKIVRINPSFQMIPKKTTSMVIGLGTNFNDNNKPCDYCAMKATCRYKQKRLSHE